jgi:hypothetical protein
MKAIFVSLVFLAASAFAQDQAAIAAAEAACGPKNVKFDAKQDANQHPVPQPDPDKALVFIIQDIGEVQCTGCALTKVGLDGAWVGANQGSSYLFFTVQPGERHICVNWQSRFELRSRAFGLANLTAEAGHVYYFRSRIFMSRYIYYFDLDPINDDQGKFLVASSAFSVSHPKK